MKPGVWVDLDDFRSAMRDISDVLQLGLTEEEIERAELGLEDTWYSPGPWLAIANHGPLDVAVEIAGDECHGVAICPTGPDSKLSELRQLVESKYRGDAPTR